MIERNGRHYVAIWFAEYMPPNALRISPMAETGNLIEGILWCVIAAAFAISLLKREWRCEKIIAAVNFAAFGASDFVEIHTGAW